MNNLDRCLQDQSTQRTTTPHSSAWLPNSSRLSDPEWSADKPNSLRSTGQNWKRCQLCLNSVSSITIFFSGWRRFHCFIHWWHISTCWVWSRQSWGQKQDLSDADSHCSTQQKEPKQRGGRNSDASTLCRYFKGRPSGKERSQCFNVQLGHVRLPWFICLYHNSDLPHIVAICESSRDNLHTTRKMIYKTR